LAAALECRVEDLFRLRSEPRAVAWAWPPRREPCRYWHADVGDGRRLYPAEVTLLGVVPYDGIYRDGSYEGDEGEDPGRSLVISGCAPAVSLLAAELARTAGVRLIALPRPSRTALTLLGQDLLHVAGVHLTRADDPGGNAAIVKKELGAGYNLLRIARWEEG